MIKHIRRRTVGVATPALILAIALGVIVAVVVVASVSGHAMWLPFGQASSHPSSQPAASPASAPLPASAATDGGPEAASLQLASQDVTPSTHLSLTASGYQGNEPLEVTIKDAAGSTYEDVTLHANGNGRLVFMTLALPQQLASGTYQVVVVGDLSHRSASAPFRMHDVPPTITLNTYTSIPGQMIGFTGNGFIAGEEVQVTLGTEKAPLAKVHATDTGAVSGQVKVPALAAGTYTLTLVGSQSQSPASVGFSIQGFAPWVVLNHYAVMPGQGVGIIGQDFAPGEQVVIYLNSTKGQPVLSVTADPSGRVVVQDSWVPSGVSGSNKLTLVGQTSKASASADFTILPGPDATPAPTSP